MADEGYFYIPDDDILREVGRIVIRHGLLDHLLRLAIKRFLGISIEDEGYASETRGMSSALRERLQELTTAKFKDNPDKRGLFESLLAVAEAQTKRRNTLVHAVWMHVPGKAPALYDKDGTAYPIPTIEILRDIERMIDVVKNILNFSSRGV